MRWLIQFGSSVMTLLISLYRVLMSKSPTKLLGFMLVRLSKISVLKALQLATDSQTRKQSKEFLVSS